VARLGGFRRCEGNSLVAPQVDFRENVSQTPFSSRSDRLLESQVHRYPVKSQVLSPRCQSAQICIRAKSAGVASWASITRNTVRSRAPASKMTNLGVLERAASM
jgi:hypothetical protein